VIVNNSIIIFSLVLILCFLLVGVWKIYKSSKNKEGRWGINLNSRSNWGKHGVLKNVQCPVCGKDLDTFRKPENMKEVLWGGWTCSGCGTSIDKWGNERNK